MAIAIKNGMTPNQVQDALVETQQMNYERKRMQKKEVLKRLDGMLSHLKMTQWKSNKKGEMAGSNN